MITYEFSTDTKYAEKMGKKSQKTTCVRFIRVINVKIKGSKKSKKKDTHY
jgi:hypothetical protein